MSELVRTETADGVFRIILDRPEKMNALSGDMVQSLLDAVEQAHRDCAHVLAFEGTGKNFSAGFDFSDLDTQSEGDLLLRFVRIETLLQAVRRSPCMTVAFAHGRNFGAGVDLFAACRLRHADATASFRMPGLKFGLVLGTRHFASLVGHQAARALLETATTFDAVHAQHIGFVQELAGQADWPALREQAAAAASRLPADSRVALYDALDASAAHEDMARLVLSAAAPGLKTRIAGYMQAR